jgi:hypothetical protein
MEQKNSQTWSWGAPTVAGGRAKTECGCQKWFGRSARYMKGKCTFNFSCHAQHRSLLVLQEGARRHRKVLCSTFSM